VQGRRADPDQGHAGLATPERDALPDQPRAHQARPQGVEEQHAAAEVLRLAGAGHARPRILLRFGYKDGASGYSIGENIAWASSSIASPKKIVSMWMHSPPHKANILTKDFRDQAVSALWSDGGVGGDYANSNGPFVVYVNQFGRRF
jgi:hypothetical protein